MSSEDIYTGDYIELEKYFENIVAEVKSSGLPVVKRFEDFVEYLPEIGIGPVGRISSRNIAAISIMLEKFQLNSEPRVHMGYIPRRYESTIVIFEKDNDVDYSSKQFKFAMLVARIMVLMAKADGEVVVEEKLEIESLIDDLQFISRSEKTTLKARAICLINDVPILGVNFYEYSINKIIELDAMSQDLVIELIKDIAVCDGYIDKSETKLLRDIYKAIELPTDNIKTELEYLAKNKRIRLRDYRNEEINRILDEDINILDMDFDVEDMLDELDL